MSKLARANCERGVSTLELTMAMPAVIFALLFLIGMGHALISKQHAVVGGQFAAHYQRVRESAPNAAAASRAVSAGAETFRLSGGGDETISYTAKATPRKGLIAQLYRLNAANSQYQTSNVTNACVPNCKPFDSFARILSPEMITGLIFSGNTSGLPTGDLLSTVEGKGKKQPRQKPEGAEAPNPINASEASVPLAMGMVPATGGDGGKPPGKPPKGAGGCAADGGESGNGGNGNGSNGNNSNAGKGNPSSTPGPKATPPPAKPNPTPRPTPKPLTPSQEASKRGAELEKEEKEKGVGQEAGRSGGHGSPRARAGARLVREANKMSKNDPRRRAYKIVGERMQSQGRSKNHRGGGRGSR
jgi:hypothetical protein